MRVVYTLVLDKTHSHVLMVRNDTRGWSLPGGGQESGETLAESARRETLEETGYRVDPVRLVSVSERLAERHDVFFVFTAKLESDEPVRQFDDPEITEVTWMEVARADESMEWYPRSVTEVAEHFEADYFVNRPMRG